MKTIKFTAESRFAILPEVLTENQGGPVAKLVLVPIPAGVPVGSAINPDELRGGEGVVEMLFDNPESLLALSHQAARAHQGLAYAVEQKKEREMAETKEAKKAHIIELAKQLQKAESEYHQAYGIPNRGVNHGDAAGAQQLADAIAALLGSPVAARS